jgi:hypothetical protein
MAEYGGIFRYRGSSSALHRQSSSHRGTSAGELFSASLGSRFIQLAAMLVVMVAVGSWVNNK